MDKRKNIKIIFFSDTHLGFDYKVNKSSRPNRGEDFFDNFHRVLERAKQIGADLIIHGGDLFEKANVNQKVIDRCYDALYQIADYGIPIVLIPGNHDPFPLPSTLFANHYNIFPLNSPSSITLSLNGKDFQIDAIPYTKNIGETISSNLSTLEKSTKDNDFKILLLHQSIEGSKVGPVDYTFGKSKRTIGKNQIPSFYDIVLSGHIHRHQIIKIPNIEEKNLSFIYSGSTERTSFSEINEEKGFVILEFHRKSQIFQAKVTFENLPTRDMHKIILDKEYASDKLLKTELLKIASTLNTNSIIRIDAKHESTRLKLQSKLLKNCFNESSIVSVKNNSEIYKSFKYKKQ